MKRIRNRMPCSLCLLSIIFTWPSLRYGPNRVLLGGVDVVGPLVPYHVRQMFPWSLNNPIASLTAPPLCGLGGWLRTAYLMCATCGCGKMGLGPRNETAQGRHKADPSGRDVRGRDG